MCIDKSQHLKNKFQLQVLKIDTFKILFYANHYLAVVVDCPKVPGNKFKLFIMLKVVLNL